MNCDPCPGKIKAVFSGSIDVPLNIAKLGFMETQIRLHKPQFLYQPVRLFLFLFHADDFAALVMPAVGAYGMWQAHLTAIAARHQIERFQSVVGAPAVAAAFG